MIFWLVEWYLHNDVVDGDVDEFHKESDEAHDRKANRCCHGNLLEFYNMSEHRR